MDMKIAGSGKVGPGEYENVKISGTGKIEGPIRCKNMHCAGAVHCYGAIDVGEDIVVSGSAHIKGDLKAGSIHVRGGVGIDGNCIVQGEIKIAGGFRCDGHIKSNKLCLDGGSRAANIEAEEIRIEGTVVCPGLVNAERIDIKINGTGSEMGSIGGSIIQIRRKQYGISRGFAFFKRKDEGRGSLKVKDSIEGDEIVLDHVKANTVVGRIVAIGSGCKIGKVQYSESIEIAPDAEVGEQIRI